MPPLNILLSEATQKVCEEYQKQELKQSQGKSECLGSLPPNPQAAFADPRNFGKANYPTIAKGLLLRQELAHYKQAPCGSPNG